MMTAREIAHRAARDLRIVGHQEGLPGEMYADALQLLNSMLTSWGTRLASVEYTPFPDEQTALDDDNAPNLPDKFEEAIWSNLAVRMAGTYNKQINPVTALMAESGWSALYGAYGWPEDTETGPFGYMNKEFRGSGL